MSQTRIKPELMSPAGHWPQLRAAIEAGADAVYFGLDHFSARAKVGFAVDELPEVMSALHERGVRGFVTFNTLVFDNELQRAENAIAAIARSGADSIIIQDLGIAKLAKQIAPQLDVHGSTQMSITSAEGAEFAKRLGCDRVVLGRELSLRDIEKIRETTDIELEVFVHGALCVSYSGQCFSSEAWGGRSANRGKCAQACRLSYDLIVDGQHRDLGADRYLLSPGDLYALEQVPELVRLGIACLKIEGRYKDANYVALTTGAYRKAIDAAWNKVEHQVTAQEKNQLEQVYSRGLGPHFMSGTNHQDVVQGRAPRHRGLKVGQVSAVEHNSVVIQYEHEIRAGDGLVFDAADRRSPDEPEEGGNVYEVRSRPDGLRLFFGDGDVDFSRVAEGDLVWRTSDPKLLAQLKPIAKPKQIHYTRSIDLRVTATVGKPLQVVGTIDDSLSVTVSSAQSLAVATNRGLSTEQLREQLGRLGGTPFHLGELHFDNDANVPLFLPVSQLNQLRRELVEALLEARRMRGRQRNINAGVIQEWYQTRQKQFPRIQTSTNETSESKESPRLHLLVRTAEQLIAAIEFKPATITLDYLELYGLRPSVEKIKASGIVARVASPRILKPAEQKIVRFLISLQCPILVRSAGLLHDLLKAKADSPEMTDLIGDFSLNAANVVSVASLLELGLSTVTPAYDLNADQIKQLCESTSPESLEVIAYSHLPVFHTEHCVFCRFMSDGTDSTNCGHPCEKHRVALRDKQGRLHPVMADVGCRNTVFGGEAQFAAEAVAKWIEAGLRDFRLEFVHESPAQVAEVTTAFQDCFAGKLTWQQLERGLKTASPAGIAEGSLFVPLEV